jgi:hypothetical protein
MRRKVVRASDLKPPHTIDDVNFGEICGAFEILANQRAAVRDFLAEAVAAFAELISRERTLPTRQADRSSIRRAIEGIRRAQHRLKRNAGPAGQPGLRLAGRDLAPALSAFWMRRHFPNDQLAPNPVYWPADDRELRRPSRTPDRPIDVEDLSLDHRIQFMKRRGGTATPKLLDDIADALENGRRAIVQSPGGRKPLENRAFFLAALAELWHRLGRRHRRPPRLSPRRVAPLALEKNRHPSCRRLIPPAPRPSPPGLRN